MPTTKLTFELALAAPCLLAQQSFVRTNAKVIALTHVRVIDGTGAAARANQTILIRNGRIEAVGNADAVRVPTEAETLDLPNHTVIPGLVGMHEHLFYPSGRGVPIYTEHAFSFPRLYLASGVTTARTGGGLEVQTDLMVKKWIDEGKYTGPNMLITAGYLEGPGSFTPQMLELRNPGDAKAFVTYWAGMGATSFKAYMHITRAELGAAIETAHANGLKVTGHLCSVGFLEAANLGIDNLEHGLIVDTEFIPGKKPDECPTVTAPSLENLDIQGAGVQETIRELVRHNVAVTSTLAVFEVAPPIQTRFADALSPQTLADYKAARERMPETTKAFSAIRIKKEQEFERAFVKSGGLLMAGADPTGNGSALAGFADQRNIELLVDAGFSAAEAIRIATLNGARFLGMDSNIGSIAAGKQADLAVIEGDPATRIADIENTRIVFRNGVGYDSAKLLESVKGMVGLH
ncbi:MAG TPA: amidohydrolase family protein [Bryobacteraceae bacterium]|nr:amidohydrolase family protein [Bryobacteraceae bacterium]